MAWLFVFVLMVLCSSLTILQYRWTGDVARAEMTMMRQSLARQAERLCNAFDEELVASRAALVPTVRELEEGAREAVFSAKLQQWKAAGRVPAFKRMAVSVGAGEDDELMEMDVESASLAPMEWPDEWGGYRESLITRRFTSTQSGQSPHSAMLRGFPVVESRGSGESSERVKWGERNERRTRSEISSEHGERDGWRRDHTRVILELDVDYFRETWMPALIAEYLNPDGNLLFDVVVRSKTPPQDMVFSSNPDFSEGGEKAMALDFNFFGSSQGRSWSGPGNARWILEVGYRAGSMESVVANSRRWNLAIAVALNGLILASGGMLVWATRRTRKLAAERMNFVANVTHELRTPLTVIRGAAHNLQRGIVKDPEAIEKYSGSILKHADALGAMIDQVLDLSGGRRYKAVRAPMNLWQVLRDTAQSVKVDPKFSACQIEIDLPAEIPEVVGDPAALRSAFRNLFENAAKHGGINGVIGITAEMREHQVEIRITDHGPGIPESEMKDIFKPFFRGANARSKHVRGSGLGLSLVKNIIEAHGGSVAVTSEFEKGSTFTVTLPT